jgi:gamma-glutamyltranspeptidase/glutathione hydrolase
VGGAIAAGHPSTAHAGAALLAAGGNAVDACLAGVFAAFAAEGPLTGPAGGGFLLVREPRGDAVVLDCFFAVPSRPLGAMEELVIDFADASTQVFHVGEESVAVPGLLAGLEVAHSRYGRLPWAELFEPALALARDGVPVNDAQAFLHEILVPILQRDEGGRRIYGHGARLSTAELVPALELIRERRGRALAELLPELADDLARYEVVERRPLTAAIAGVELVTTPAPSIGGAIVRDALAGLVQGRDANDHARALGLAYRSAGTTTRVTGTTHVSVVDSDGLVAGLSSTLGSGSGVFRHGFQLNNMLGELDVIGPGPRAPGERLTSMMAPTLLLQEGRPRLVVGSAGSVRLAGAIAQVAWHVMTGASVSAAVAAPRLHVEGRTVHVEGGRGDDASALLAAGGAWDVVEWADRNLFFGGASAVERRADGSLDAAGDPRRGGHGVVVP